MADFKAQLRAYYQLIKPERTFANVMTATAGFFLASQHHVLSGLLAATLVGSSLVVASACVLNNYTDRFLDKKMARTKNRALVKGVIPPRDALIFAIFLGIDGFLILIFYVNALVAVLGVIGYLDYVALYAITKRRSIYGTIAGSISGAIPITSGYCAVTNRVDAGAVILFLIMVLWQMPHFYAIAMYRFNDYKRAGIPVLPVKRGVRRTKFEILAYIIAFTLAAVALTVYDFAGYIYVIVMALLGASWFYKGIAGYRSSDDAAYGRKMFSFSLIVLTAFSVILAVNALLP